MFEWVVKGADQDSYQRRLDRGPQELEGSGVTGDVERFLAVIFGDINGHSTTTPPKPVPAVYPIIL